MTSEETVSALREFVGHTVGINLTDERYGLADSYLADFRGCFAHRRADRRRRCVRSYFRIDEGAGFGVHEGMFRNAEWQRIASERPLRIELDGVVITITPEAGQQKYLLSSDFELEVPGSNR